jgi:hypothetical protein
MLEHVGEAQAFEVEAETLVRAHCWLLAGLAGGVGHNLSSHVVAPALLAKLFPSGAETQRVTTHFSSIRINSLRK